MKKLYLPTLLILLSLSLTACLDLPGNNPPPTKVVPTTSATLPTSQPTEAVTEEPATENPVIISTPGGDAATATPVLADTPTVSGEPGQSEAPQPTQVPVQTPTPTKKPVVGNATQKPAPTTRPATTKPALVPTFTAVPTLVSSTYNGPLSEVVRGKTGKKQVAITIDAGADAKAFPKIYAALNQYGVHITFFLTGLWVQQNPNYTQQIVAAGHEVGNHSWDHPDFTKLTDEQATSEIQRTDALLARFTGQSSRPLWRFPYGSRNAHLMQLVNNLGYRSFFWTIDSLDSVGQPKTAQFLIDRITKQTDSQLDGEIILMHIGNATTGDALPAILENLQERGFRVVTVSQLLS